MVRVADSRSILKAESKGLGNRLNVRYKRKGEDKYESKVFGLSNRMKIPFTEITEMAKRFDERNQDVRIAMFSVRSSILIRQVNINLV